MQGVPGWLPGQGARSHAITRVYTHGPHIQWVKDLSPNRPGTNRTSNKYLNKIMLDKKRVRTFCFVSYYYGKHSIYYSRYWCTVWFYDLFFNNSKRCFHSPSVLKVFIKCILYSSRTSYVLIEIIIYMFFIFNKN